MALVLERDHPVASSVGSGVQKVYRFANGYGASVVRFTIGGLNGSYGATAGQWELAVVKFYGEAPDEFTIVYDTPVTSDVLGYLDDEDVNATLDVIEALPA